jgi:nucleoside-diphosphate-sugar epimerase
MKGYQVYNYVDKPDMNMNELVSQVESSLGKKLPKTRLPFWLGMLGGYSFDLLRFITHKQFSVSSVRVKKFCSTTQFDSTKAHSSGFKAPFSLQEGLDKTLKHEFNES